MILPAVPFEMSVKTAYRSEGPVCRDSRKLSGPEMSFYYDFQIRKGKFVATFHAWKRVHWNYMAPLMRPKRFGSFKKRAPGCRLSWASVQSGVKS